MPDEIETILRLVAEGHLDVEAADRIIAALEGRAAGEADRRRDAPPAETQPPSPTDTQGAARRPRAMRIRVTEHGRQVVNLRLPLALADAALSRVPGLSREHRERVTAAIEAGLTGPLVDIEDEDGDGVLVIME
jgi:hypothetical protein